jgi:hypothetical protein
MLTNIQEIEESGIIYYVIPENYSLFKATKTYDIASGGLYLDPEGFYFFGVKDETPEYIESYEKEYGIIFEFTTTRPYKLLALDTKETQTKLYEDAPREIQFILEKNYGYINGLRDSESNNDRKLSEYICNQGYHGYAIKHMSTHLGGSFHPEFMFCDISGINYVKKITSDVRVNEILAERKEKEIAEQLKEERKNKRNKRNNQNYNMDETDDNNIEKRFKPKTLSFTNDDDDDEMEMENGGSKRRSYKRQKKTIKKIRNTIKKHVKKNIRKTIKTRKIRRKNNKSNCK